MADVKDDIEKYLNGEMTPAEMHALEKRALSDPFLADALEGSSSILPQHLADDLNLLQASLKKRTTKSTGGFHWNWPLRIAASIILLAVSSYLVFNLIDQSDVKEESLALNKEEKPSETQSNAVVDSVTTESSTPTEEKVEIDASSEHPAQPSQTPASHKLADTSEPAALEVMPAETLDLNIAQAEEEKQTEEHQMKPEDVSGFTMLSDSMSASRKKAEVSAPATERIATIMPANKIITGKVTDGDDGLPLPGVNVMVKSSTIGTVTDLNGNFEIELPVNQDALVFSYIGMEVKEVQLPENDQAEEQTIEVQMAPDVSQLSEIVVTGYAEDESEFEGTKWELAEPEGGKKEYNEYLQKNLIYPQVAIENKVEGKVTVQFTVQPSGQLTDFRVVKSLGSGCDEELIRLIKEGPAWKPTKRNDEPVKGKAKVKMKFSLKDKKN